MQKSLPSYESDWPSIAVAALSHCRFVPASWNKRFVADLAARWSAGNHKLSSSQAKHLWRLVWECRRQIADKELVRHALTLQSEGKEDMALMLLIEECEK